MKQAIVILLTLLVPSSAFATAPDLCAEDVYLNSHGEPATDSQGRTLSRYCEWTGPDAPLLAADVCCSIDAVGAACMIRDKGECESGLEPFHCKYGQASAAGVVCYQPFPSTCSLELCSDVAPPDDDPQEDVICCIGGSCFPWDGNYPHDCGGLYTWCNDGYSKLDGTVECFD